jgi:Mannosyl-glycoprotein endo-beta-N-acetylglucosaminidase
VRRLHFRLRQHAIAAAVTVLSLFAAPAAQARTLFDAASDMETAVATVVPSHFPSWVQVAVASAPLYFADTASDQVASHLPRQTFLRVINSGAARLQVEAYDESGAPGQQGWVDPNQVLPSASGTDWLVSSTATTLWSTSDAGAASARNLDRFTPLQQVAPPVRGRIPVLVYRSDFSGVADQGWIDASSAGPALPPQVRVPAPTDRPVGLRSVSSTSQQQAFLDAAAQAARVATAQTGVPASVTVAQAILESDWGRSLLAQSANNYFGMKAMGSLGTDGVVYMPTSEYDADGALYETVSAFRAYTSLADSMADHDRLLGTASRYAQAMRAASDPRQFAALIAQAGYSTDPAYADKLVSLMDRYNLYQLDA